MARGNGRSWAPVIAPVDDQYQIVFLSQATLFPPPPPNTNLASSTNVYANLSHGLISKNLAGTDAGHRRLQAGVEPEPQRRERGSVGRRVRDRRLLRADRHLDVVEAVAHSRICAAR